MHSRRHSAGANRPSQADQAYLQLERLIVSLELSPGSIWTEATLSEKLGIGRTPVREAVLKLAGYQLVSIVQRHGIRISDINEREQLLILETRRELDRLIASRAARRATDAEKSTLMQMAQTIRKTGKRRDVTKFVKLFFEAKRFLSSCARNRYAEHAVAPLYVASHRFYQLHHSLSDLKMVADLHADLMEAVARGDQESAKILTDRQLDYAELLTRQAMKFES